jgi:hypothetical protein
MAAWDDPEGYRRSLERKLSRVRGLADAMRTWEFITPQSAAGAILDALEDQ